MKGEKHYNKTITLNPQETTIQTVTIKTEDNIAGGAYTLTIIAQSKHTTAVDAIQVTVNSGDPEETNENIPENVWNESNSETDKSKNKSNDKSNNNFNNNFNNITDSINSEHNLTENSTDTIENFPAQETETASLDSGSGESQTVSLSSIPPSGNLTYDANGNLIAGFGKCFEYNDANQLANVTNCSGTTIAEYTYNHAGRRTIKKEFKQNLNITTYYISSYFETTIYSNGTETNTSYYYANGERVAKKVNNNTNLNYYYIHGDHLGSTDVITNETGGVVEKTEYYPFGATREGGEKEKYLFTGQEHDSETGLYYYGARYYSAEVRRFVQADPMIPDVYNPQYLNRYSYVLNNPVKYTDPSGEWAILVAAAYVGIQTLSGFAEANVEYALNHYEDVEYASETGDWGSLATDYSNNFGDEVLPATAVNAGINCLTAGVGKFRLAPKFGDKVSLIAKNYARGMKLQNQIKNSLIKKYGDSVLPKEYIFKGGGRVDIAVKKGGGKFGFHEVKSVVWNSKSYIDNPGAVTSRINKIEKQLLNYKGSMKEGDTLTLHITKPENGEIADQIIDMTTRNDIKLEWV